MSNVLYARVLLSLSFRITN